MSLNGCDIDWNKPSGAALAAAGYKVASLYVGQDNTGKNLSAAVVADYHAHGVAVIVNFEFGAQQMLGGASQGATDARLGWAQAQAAGIAVRAIYYSADWAVTAGQLLTVLQYLLAARSVTGPGTVGVYGSYAVVKYVHEYWASHFPGEKVYLWQTVAWSGGQVYSPLDAYQDGSQHSVGGISIDYDLIISDDAGQWPQPEEQVVLTSDDINAVATATSALLRNTELGEQNLDGTQVGTGHTISLGVATSQTRARQTQLMDKLNALSTPVVDPAALGAALAGNAAFVDAVATAVAAKMPTHITETGTLS